ARPFIEVADNQTRMLQLRREQDLTAHQQPRLFSPLHVSSAQMDVEEMDNLARRDFQITANAAAGLAARGRQIINAHFLDRKAAEHNVAIYGAAQLARLTDAIV